MATNFGLKLDPLTLKGSSTRNLQGQPATTRCLIIPFDECDVIFLGEKGCYLNLTAIEMQNPQFSDTHCIKPDIPKEQREAMTPEEQKAVPIIGGLHAIEVKQQTMNVSGTLGQEAFSENDDDLPF